MTSWSLWRRGFTSPCGPMPPSPKGHPFQVVTAAGFHLWADLRDEEAADLVPGSEVAVRWSPGATSVWAEAPDLDKEDAVT